MKKMDKKVSIVIPVYNSVKYLDRCLGSIKSQTYADIEIIVVDDGSNEEIREQSREIVSRLGNARLIAHEENRGLFQARMTGFRESTGEYITTIDSDDYIDADYIEKLVARMESEQADMCMADYELEQFTAGPRLFQIPFAENKDAYTGEECFDFLFFWGVNRSYQLWNKMITKALYKRASKDLEKIASESDKIVAGEDNVYLTVLAHHAKKLVFMHGPKYHYCLHDEQSSVMKEREKFISQLKSFLKSSEIIKQYLLQKKVEERYLDRFDRYVDFTEHNMFDLAIKLKLIKEFREIVPKFGKKSTFFSKLKVKTR